MATENNFSEVVISIAGFVLAISVLSYQVRNDKRNIRLQWFKELLITPNLNRIRGFYKTLDLIHSDIFSNPVDDDGVIAKTALVRSRYDRLNKTFVTLLYVVDPELGKTIKENLDVVTNIMYSAIAQCEHSKANNIAKSHSAMVENSIVDSQRDLIFSIYNHKARLQISDVGFYVILFSLLGIAIFSFTYL